MVFWYISFCKNQKAKKKCGVIPWSLSLPLRIVGISILTRKYVHIPNTDVPLHSFCSLHNRISVDSPRPNDFAVSWRPPWELKWNHLKIHCTKHILKNHKYLKKPKLSVQECKLKNDDYEISNGNKLCFSKRSLLNKLPQKHVLHKQKVKQYKKRFTKKRFTITILYMTLSYFEQYFLGLLREVIYLEEM